MMRRPSGKRWRKMMNTDDKIRLYVPLIGAAFILVVLLIGAGIKQRCAANIVHQPRPDTEVMEPVENDAEIEKERPDIVSDIGKEG